MPVSTSVHISHCLQYICNLQPQSVLDVGCGFGIWGFLCREYLDVMAGRVWPAQWQVRIDGIELFEPYIMDHQRFLYSSVRVGDAREAVRDMGPYDLVIAGDIVEHLEKEDGEEFLETLYGRANRALLVNIPLAEGWEHPEAYGNPGELHRSIWYPEDFAPFLPTFTEFPVGLNLRYGVFYCSKPAGDRAPNYVLAADFHEQRGDIRTAIRYLKRGHALDPGHEACVFLLADLLIRTNAPEAAVAALEEAVQYRPAFHKGHFILAQLLVVTGKTEKAEARLRALTAFEDIPPALREQAQGLLRRIAG